MNPQLLIDNRWVASAARLTVVNPFTGEEIARVPLGNVEHLEQAIAAAQRAFVKVRALPSHERAALLLAVASEIERRRSEFVDTIVGEAGKPIVFAEAEVARAVMTFTAAAEEARRSHGELIAMDAFSPGEGHFGMARRFPIGAIAAITPFNFPLNLVAHKVAPCLATGNTMVVKPATKTPLTALLLAEVLVAAGMPPGQVNFVTCTNEDAAILVRDQRVKMVTFTGSPAVGWKLKEQCGRKRITLELGGNAGCIVHADADLETAIPMIALGAFAQAGQSCISVQRVVVHESIYENFRDRLARHVQEKIVSGDPRQRETVIGPLITGDALARIRGVIDQAVAAGARIIVGGQARGPCLEATIIEDAPPGCALCTDEAFAPVVTLHRYREFEDALAFVNDSRFGLQAGVFTRDLNLAMRAFEALEVGGVMVNQVPTFRVENMPYGGVKESGFGREGVRSAMEAMTELKTLVIKLQ